MILDCSNNDRSINLINKKINSIKYDSEKKCYFMELEGEKLIYFNDYWEEVKCGYCNNLTKTNLPYPSETIWKKHHIYNGSISDEKGHKIKIGTKYQCTNCNVKERIKNY